MRGNSLSCLFTDVYRCLLACPALRKLCELVTCTQRGNGNPTTLYALLGRSD